MTEQIMCEVPRFRLQLVHESTVTVKFINSARDMVEYFGDFAGSDREQVLAVYLNNQNQPIAQHLVSVGTINASVMSPREVYKGALLANAIGVILMHNHPSGAIFPSEEDDEITCNIARAGKLIDIQLIDSIIVSPTGDFYSYLEQQPHLLKGENDHDHHAHHRPRPAPRKFWTGQFHCSLHQIHL